MNDTYDILFAPRERDFSETYMDWSVYEKNLPLSNAILTIANELETDAFNGRESDWCYRLVKHGEGGNII